jgi:hypothetical protein
MNKVLMIGVITIPLIMFMALFGGRIMDNFKSNSTQSKSETNTLLQKAGQGAF